VDVLDTVRRRRNLINYERAGTTSEAEAEEFYKTVTTLRSDVVRWLKRKHPALAPPDVTA